MATGVQVIGTPGHSPVLKYELQLAEVRRQGDATSERIDLAFHILDDLIPQLGIFQRIMKLLRQELYIATYSDEYTAGVGKGRRSSVEPVRVPHFIVARKINTDRDKQVTKLKEKIESLKEQLYNCEADLEKASSALEASKYDVKENEAKILNLTQNLKSVIEERDHLQLLASQHHEIVKTITDKGESEIVALQETVNSLEFEVKDLETYKTTHLKLQSAFLPVKPSKGTNKTTATTLALNSTHKGRLEEDHDHSTVLMKQLLMMQNKLIDQYEMDTVLHTDTPAAILQSHQDKFKASMDLIETELSLLTSHNEALSSRLAHLSSLNPAHSHQAIIQSDHPVSPLISQEQVLSKYSAMLYCSSDQGKSYYAVKESNDCLSCGQKVVICPHWSEKELIIQLPLNSTHVKITHPKPLVKSSPSKHRQEYPSKEETITGDDIKRGGGGGDSIMRPDFDKIWKKFTSKYTINRPFPRDLSIETIMSVVKLFYGGQLKSDRSPPSNLVPVQPLSSSFFQFMKVHYHTSNIGLLACYDILRKLQDIYHQHTVLCLFCHVLAGSLEPAVFRYHLLMSDFVDIISWDGNSFDRWSRVVYPFLEEEGREQLSIEYTGYSRNQSSKSTVLDYVLWLILKQREPLLLQMESTLSDQKTLHPGSMSEHEFAEFCLTLYPGSSDIDVLAICLYSQSLAQHKMGGRKDETIPFRQLASILGYIHLLHSSPSITERLGSDGSQDNVSNSTGIRDNGILKLSDITRNV